MQDLKLSLLSSASSHHLAGSEITLFQPLVQSMVEEGLLSDFSRRNTFFHEVCKACQWTKDNENCLVCNGYGYIPVEGNAVPPHLRIYGITRKGRELLLVNGGPDRGGRCHQSHETGPLGS